MPFERMHELEAPHVPHFSQSVDDIFSLLQKLDANDPQFEQLVHEITANFDEFPDEPLPGAPEGLIGKGSRLSSLHRDPKFIGYTYTKPKMKPTMEMVEKVLEETHSGIAKDNSQDEGGEGAAAAQSSSPAPPSPPPPKAGAAQAPR
jgi:hypothetical protein